MHQSGVDVLPRSVLILIVGWGKGGPQDVVGLGDLIDGQAGRVIGEVLTDLLSVDSRGSVGQTEYVLP
jgi:hypothetical protein